MSDTPAQRTKARQVVDDVVTMYLRGDGGSNAAVPIVEAALAASPVAVWTKVRPVTPGWYWYKWQPDWESQVVEVRGYGDNLYVESSHVEIMQGEWCPIPPPQEGGA